MQIHRFVLCLVICLVFSSTLSEVAALATSPKVQTTAQAQAQAAADERLTPGEPIHFQYRGENYSIPRNYIRGWPNVPDQKAYLVGMSYHTSPPDSIQLFLQWRSGTVLPCCILDSHPPESPVVEYDAWLRPAIALAPGKRFVPQRMLDPELASLNFAHLKYLGSNSGWADFSLNGDQDKNLSCIKEQFFRKPTDKVPDPKSKFVSCKYDTTLTEKTHLHANIDGSVITEIDKELPVFDDLIRSFVH